VEGLVVCSDVVEGIDVVVDDDDDDDDDVEDSVAGVVVVVDVVDTTFFGIDSIRLVRLIIVFLMVPSGSH